MTANFRYCHHEHSEAVEVRSHATGSVEVVARICKDCLIQLPAGWGCPRCEWVEDRTLGDPAPITILARPCQEHA